VLIFHAQAQYEESGELRPGHAYSISKKEPMNHAETWSNEYARSALTISLRPNARVSKWR
jgi:hypothetical protein